MDDNKHGEKDLEKANDEKEAANHEMRKAFAKHRAGEITDEELRAVKDKLNIAVMNEQNASQPVPTNDEVSAALAPRDRKRDANYSTRQATAGTREAQASQAQKTAEQQSGKPSDNKNK